MPDLLSHLIIGLILAELFNIRKRSLVVLGAIIPDILSKIHLIFFYLGIPPLFSSISFHTPFMAFLISILIASLFKYDKLKLILFFNLGAASHFLSDLTIKHFTVQGSRLFFPISSSNYTFNLVWPEQSIFILFGSVMLYLLIRMIKKNNITNKSKL